jgi:uncharacterized protein
MSKAGLAGLMLLALPVPASAQTAELDALREKAVTGDAAAQFEMAFSLEAFALADGATDEQAASNPLLVEARTWAKSAADSGNAEALNAYGAMVRMGVGGQKDEDAGLAIIRQAAELGSEGANLTLADEYLESDSDVRRSIGLQYNLAAAQSPLPSPNNHCYAQWKLGMNILNGRGTDANSQHAYTWVKRSADNGCAVGMISQAVMLATGDGVDEDDRLARALYEKAALTGDVNTPHALRGLGAMLLTGEGGPVDLVRGFAYLMLAGAAGDEIAGSVLDEFSDQFTDDIRDRSLAYAEQWASEHLDVQGE